MPTLLTAESQHHDQHQASTRRPPSPLPQTQHVPHNDQGEACGDGSGQAPLITAFAQSRDTTFAKIGIQVGANALNDMAEQFGMNDANLDRPAARGEEQSRDTGPARR